jgi:hypothetical protein
MLLASLLMIGTNSFAATKTSDAKVWVQNHVQNFDLIPAENPEKADTVYRMVSLFLPRLNNWKKLKVDFYDQYFATDAAKKLYPDALPAALVNNGIFFKIMDSQEKVTDSIALQHLRGQTVGQVYGYQGDTRPMAELAALASRQLILVPVSGISGLPRYCDFNHEFGHLVHLTLLTREEFETIDKMYAQAKSENRFVDDYAAQSASEYFAVGLEAFISESKVEADKKYKYYSHTNAELLQINPELHAFFTKLIRP